MCDSKIELLVDEIEVQLQQRNIREISSADLGEMLLTQLREINEVAYIRFASVHRKFHGINDFITTLETFKNSKEQLATVI